MSDIIGSLIDGASQFFTNRSNERSVNNTNAVNRQIADATNQANMAMNAQNIQFQRETNDLNYARQKAENDLTRQREDTAYSRAASDLESAGLSKTLAAGEPASSSAMQSAVAQSPENKFQMQRYEQKAFQANAVKMDLDILESLQKVKNIQSTDLQNKFQEWYNSFVDKWNLLPGTSSTFNNAIGAYDLVKWSLEQATGKPVGQESPVSIGAFETNSALNKLAKSVGSSSVALPDVSSPLTQTSRGHNDISLPSFSRAMVNDLPLENSTKKVLFDTATEVSNVNTKSKWSIPDFVYNPASLSGLGNLVNNSKELKSYVKANLPALKQTLSNPSTWRNGLTSLALLSILGTGSASAMSFLDNDKKALRKFK